MIYGGRFRLLYKTFLINYKNMKTTLERIFEGLFNNERTTSERLVKYADDQISKTEANNPAAVYDVIITETKTKSTTLQTILNTAQNSQATGKGGTVEKNQARKDCELFLSRGEGLIKYHYAEGSPIYIEFYPNGISAFIRASDPEFKTMMNVFVEKANDYKVKLGNDFAAEATAKNQAFIASADDHTNDNTNISTSRSNEQIAHDELALQLTKNVLTIALQNLGNVNAVKTYFNTSLLYAAYHQQTFNLSLPSNQVQTPVEKHFTANAEITITASQIVEISLSNTKDLMQKNKITINPNEQTTIKLVDFNVELNTHPFLVIKNIGSDIAAVKVEL